ncbi:carotenoid biosynthesis protein [Parasediminibacterium sp. JCM 36343]|uniref:carotenoid biosynthesis protein n=1 Tax=Parasediminibacterium sp. JCM 36343 TaxID=3374279 RepID=UPI00397C675E
MTKTYFTKHNIAIFIAILFHFCGAIGILFSPNSNWFIQNTPFNLLLMAVLLFWVQPQKNIPFFLFFFTAFLIGMGAEMIGVNTGKLFGSYHYSATMGKQLNGVPYLIGINWFVVVFCSGVLLNKANDWLEEQYELADIQLRPWLKTVSFVVDGALVATLFDYILEPVAAKLHLWEWHGHTIPNYNFVCWFCISCLLLLVFKWLHFDKQNQFAMHLLIIQSLFFIALQISMP